MAVVVAGATGFVGTRLVEALAARGVEVRAGSRRRREFAGARWVELDVDRPETLPGALAGARAAVYLVHGMDGRDGYAEREARAAEAFARASADAGLERLVYLGGVSPEGETSEHLASRRRTGEGLRAGRVPVFELRAATILGAGSASWRLLRDVALRLPVLVAPPWLRGVSEPVALDDVVAAIVAACEVPLERAGVYGLPGPESMNGLEMLQRICAVRGRDPRVVPVPLLPRRLAGAAAGLLTGCAPHLARELVQGMGPGLEARDPPFWALMPGHRRVGFDEMVRRAFVGEGPDWRLAPLAAEWLSWAASRKLAR